MLKILKKFFEESKKFDDFTNSNLELICGLMIEAANSDGLIDEKELEKINLVLINTFEEDPKDVKTTLSNALKNRDNSKSLFIILPK